MSTQIRTLLKKAKGFTLIELLIVIAIIAILTVAFLPTVRSGQSSARNAARKSEASDIAVAIQRIANGDVPSGVTLNLASSGAVPIQISSGVYSGCLDFSAASSLGSDLRAMMGSTPAPQLTNVQLCNATSGFYYRAFKSTAAVTSAATDVATNFIVAVQLENGTSTANVSRAGITLTSATATGGADTALGAAGVFDTWTNVLTNTTGMPQSPLFVVTQ